MRFLAAIIVVCNAACFWSCANMANNKTILHAADSLSGALVVVTDQIKNCDTLALEKAIKKGQDYTAFVSAHVNDTLTKQEAEYLQTFSQAHQQLMAFSLNRKKLLERSAMVQSQLKKLSADAQKNAVASNVLLAFFQREQVQATLVIQHSGKQLALFQTALGQLRSTVAGVETLIRNRNRGELPLVINNEAAF